MIIDELEPLVRGAVEGACQAGALPPSARDCAYTVEPARNRDHGDYTTNAALTIASACGLPPRAAAAGIVEHMALDGSPVETVEIAGPGFINFRLRSDWLQGVIVEIERAGSAYGHNITMSGHRVLLEFVSANPTGPISVVNGRAAALGDSLRRLFMASGAEVATEFYVNDALNSTQIDLLAASLEARYRQALGQEAEVPAEGYQGDYLIRIAADLARTYGASLAELPDAERPDRFRTLAIETMLERQRQDLAVFGVEFDRWFLESSLYESGAVTSAIESMQAAGFTYEKDGAVWLRTTELTGDDQDRVLVRSDERATYVAADAAYHKDKFDRGFTDLVNIWGADHHGYVARLKAGIKALGYDSDRCSIILTQMILLTRDGELVKGSKRAGDVIPLADLVEEIGRDASRYYCLLTSYETTASFDLEVAKRESADNPVYYAQYAHARCSAVLRRAEESRLPEVNASDVERSLLRNPKELELLRVLAEYPREVQLAAENKAPHRLTAYVRVIGQALHQFYEECPALKDDVPFPVRDARLALFRATRTVVANLLGLLGVAAPDRM